MKLRITLSIILSAVINLLPLYLTVNYVGGNDGLGALLLIFAVLCPIWSVILGILSGKDFKKLIYLPIVNGLLFLAGGFVFLGIDFTFVIAAVIYTAIGIAVSAIRAAIIKRKAQ